MILDPIRAAIAPYALAIKAGIALILLLAAFIGGCQVNAGKLADERAAHKATKTAHAAVLSDLAAKTKVAEEAAKAASAQFARDRKAGDDRFKQAKRDSDHEIADLRRALRAGAVQLRPEFARPAARSAETGALAAAGGQDAETELRRAREGAILDDIADHDHADRWIEWLQAELTSTRKACGVEP